MPRNMSFFVTPEQIRNRTKTVTRRRGWDALKVGDLINAVVKAQGLKPGQKPEFLALLRITDIRREPLDAITAEDVVREGFPEMSPAEFVALFCAKMGGESEQQVKRIEFMYMEGAQSATGKNGITPEVKAERIAIANQVLDLFAQGTRITLNQPNNRLYVSWPSKYAPDGQRYSFTWRTRKGSDFFPVWHNKWGHGGTACTALANLIRWIQGKPCFGMDTWRYWAGEGLRLFGSKDVSAAFTAMHTAGMPQTPDCILCYQPAQGLDWWSLNGATGPCCAFTHVKGCRQEGRRKQHEQ